MAFSNAQEMGRPITIKDEGITLTSNVGSINFVGSGVSGSVIGSDVTETITGGGGGGTNVVTEVVSGVQSGNNVTLDLTSLAHTFSTVLLVTKQGQILTPNNTTYGWTILGNIITIYNALASNEDYQVQYTYA